MTHAAAVAEIHAGGTSGLKTLTWWRYVTAKMPNAEWVGKGDDDTFINLPRLFYRLPRAADVPMHSLFGTIKWGCYSDQRLKWEPSYKTWPCGRTAFARYGWVHTFAEYDAYAAATPGKYSYELWFGHRGLARASLDARQALIRGAAAAYDDRGTLETDAVALSDEEAVDGSHSAASVADYTDDGYDDEELPFPMDIDEANGEGEGVEEGATDGAGLAADEVAALAPPCPPQLLLDCAEDDTF